MTPLPKRKHSTRRKGKAFASKAVTFSPLVVCKNCGKQKQPHRACKYCKK